MHMYLHSCMCTRLCVDMFTNAYIASYICMWHLYLIALESMLYIHDEDSLVPPDETFENDKHACIKGIQGCKNSCYLDATIYGMFTFSNAFDIVFLDEIKTDNEICYAQRMLKNKIVYPLRV